MCFLLPVRKLWLEVVGVSPDHTGRAPDILGKGIHSNSPYEGVLGALGSFSQGTPGIALCPNIPVKYILLRY